MNPEAVMEEIRSGTFRPVYFLHGEEPFYIDQITQLIEETALVAHEKGFNQVVCYGKEVNIGTILNQARRYPMMAERTVVIVREAQEIPDLGKEDARQLLEKYLLTPQLSTVLVLAHKHKSLNSRKSLAKALEKHALVVETKKLYDNKLPDWIIAYAKQQGWQLQPDAARLMAEHIGNDLIRIAKELDKLLLNLRQKQPIGPEQIQQYVGISREYNSFELQKALQQRDVLKANRIVREFAKNSKDHPLIPLIALLYNYFSRLLLVHQTPDKSETNLARLLKVNAFFVKDYLQGIKHYPPGKVLYILQLLHQADLWSKGVDTTMEEGDILTELVFRILH
jgi:DNA polymerase-3 subunit delta